MWAVFFELGGWIPLLTNEVYERSQVRIPEFLNNFCLDWSCWLKKAPKLWVTKNMQQVTSSYWSLNIFKCTQIQYWNIWNLSIFYYIYNHIIFTWSVCSQWGPEIMMTQCFCWWSVCCFYFQKLLRLSPLPVTVTTRIITFLIGDPNLNLHLPQESWEGGQPKINLIRLSKGWCAFHKQQLKFESWTTWSRVPSNCPLFAGEFDLRDLKGTFPCEYIYIYMHVFWDMKQM